MRQTFIENVCGLSSTSSQCQIMFNGRSTRNLSVSVEDLTQSHPIIKLKHLRVSLLASRTNGVRLPDFHDDPLESVLWGGRLLDLDSPP